MLQTFDYSFDMEPGHKRSYFSLTFVKRTDFAIKRLISAWVVYSYAMDTIHDRLSIVECSELCRIQDGGRL